MKIKFYWHNYKYFHYEKELAKRELEVLFNSRVLHEPEYLEVDISDNWIETSKKTTYFSYAKGPNETIVIPYQTILESTVNGTLKEKNHQNSKQSTRYSSHGLHEYRGKYNPQIVRVIGNIMEIQKDDWVFDPFCGSGTTLVEAKHIGWNALGIDRNPLSEFIANAKIAVLSVTTDELIHAFKNIRLSLKQKSKGVNFSINLNDIYKKKLITESIEDYLPDFDYLQSWFIEDVLYQIACILQEIEKISTIQLKLVFKVLLSDLIREISLQEPSDLRIRRRKDFPINTDVISKYIQASEKKIETICNAKEKLEQSKTIQRAILGDVRYAKKDLSKLIQKIPGNKFNAAITSPPYATGLPYVDTNRLSLVLFDLINSDSIQETQKSLVGNREISKKERDRLNDALQRNADKLPNDVIAYCRELQDSVSKNDGFRRQNKPGLIYKYFVDMAQGFREVSELLYPDSPYALIVGRNKTTLGGKTFTIDTPQLLSMVAQANGFSLQEIIDLDTYQRFDIHKNNSIKSESLIILRKK